MRTRGQSKPTATSNEPKVQKTSKSINASKSVQKKQIKPKDIQKRQEKIQQKQQQVVQVKKQEKKQKKLPEPKKYLHKNYDQASRIARSQYQKIYLLQAKRDEEEGWNFSVQGTSGSNYKVHVHNTGLKCTCVDFRMKQKPCKHIYFIVTQVAQNNQFLDYFNNSLKISKKAFELLDEQLVKRLKSRMEKSEEKPNKQIDLKDDKDCTICFTDMNKDTQTLEDCPTCKKYFHFECLSAWKKHNPTCPLCRSHLVKPSKTDDPLGKLSTIQLTSQE